MQFGTVFALSYMCICAPSEAASVTYSDLIHTMDHSNSAGPLLYPEFPKFNPGIGHLTSVYVNLSGTVEVAGSWNTSAAANFLILWYGSYGPVEFDSNYSIVAGRADVDPYSLSAAGFAYGGRIVPGDVGSFYLKRLFSDDTHIIRQIDVDSFIGTGTYFGQLEEDFSLYPETFGDPRPESYNFHGSADYVLSVKYEYYAAVAEPETWWIMIAGFGLTGAAMRRRREVAAYS